MSALSKKLEYYEKAGQIVKNTLQKTMRLLHAGASILDIAELTEREIVRRGGIPAFPSNVSVNGAVAHNTPSADDVTQVEKADMLKIDLGAHSGGYIVDRAITCEIETTNNSEMISTAQNALNEGIRTIRHGVATSTVAEKIESLIASTGFTPICSCRGHTLKRYTLHGNVSIPICFEEGGATLLAGDVAAIEVFLTNGVGKTTATHTEIYSVKVGVDLRDLDVKSRNFASHLISNYGRMPFAVRWLPGERDKNVRRIDELLKYGVLIEYPATIESSGGLVVHFEQTLAVTKDSYIVF
jgi:methionyl aminopeptidase